MSVPQPSVIEALRLNPYCAGLDTPVLEYLAAALLDLCDDAVENAEEAHDVLAPFVEAGFTDGEELLRSVKFARDAPPVAPACAPAPATHPPTAGAAELALPEDHTEAFWDNSLLVPDPGAAWGDWDDGDELPESADWEGGEEAWRAADAHVTSLRVEFPAVDEATICGVLLSLAGDVAATREALAQLPPPPPPPPPDVDDSTTFPSLGQKAVSSRAHAMQHFARAAASGAIGNTGVAPPKSGIARMARPAVFSTPLSTALPGGVPAARWVDTGASVSGLYSSLRNEALDHVRLRNACFEQATRAYIAGDGALAKKLAAQGRRHAAAMFEAHNSAAAATFAARNASDAQRGDVPLIDLHGLHVTEALTMCRSALLSVRSERGPGAVVHVLVGTGHHTKVSAARVPAAVQALIKDELHLRYRQRTAGLLEVTV
jgi:Domain of unknown function (DUF1771)